MYTDFAKVYDLFMEDIPYDKWASYIVGLLRENDVLEGSVTELGCGTGCVTMHLAAAGYEMTGIDISEQMLMEASEKLEEENITYVHMDMRELELPRPAKAIVSVCDSINYLVEDGELEEVARRVYDNLSSGGLFIFDLKTPYFYEKVLGCTTIAENRENASFIWENVYDEESMINEYYLSLFIRGEDDRYDRYEELHYQRAYEIEEVINVLKTVDFCDIQVYNAFTKKSPGPRCQRYYIVCRKGK